MNTQPNFNTTNQNAINDFFKASSFFVPTAKQPIQSAVNYSKIEHYVKMILLSLNVEEERIQAHRNFYEDFDFDVLTHFNLILLVESYFHISITDEEAEQSSTVEKLQKLIESKLLF